MSKDRLKGSRSQRGSSMGHTEDGAAMVWEEPMRAALPAVFWEVHWLLLG